MSTDPMVQIGRKQRTNRINLTVTGMHCVNCARAVELGIIRAGGSEVSIDVGRDAVSFEAVDPSTLSSVTKKIQQLGYSVKIKEEPGKTSQSKSLSQELSISFIVSLICFLPLMAGMIFPALALLHSPHIQALLAFPPFILGVRYFGRSAWRSLKNGFPNMDVLIVSGILSAYICSLLSLFLGFGHEYIFFEASTSIVTFVLLGNLIEQKAVRQTTSSLSDLIALQSSKAKIIRSDGTIEEVASTKIVKGDILLIASGDRVLADGVVVEGTGDIDESFISGESTPKPVKSGDSVTAGTILSGGSLKIKAQAVGEDTVLSSIVRLVQRASSHKPKIQRIGDTVAAWFVPLVLLFAVSTLIVSVGFFHVRVSEAILRTLAVIAVACPCAMGLAAPTAVMVALGRAARRGILIKGGDTLERLAKVKSFIFDKTGTLTTSSFKVLPLEAVEGDIDFLASVVVALERHSSHPIAKTLVAELPLLHRVQLLELESVHETSGISVTGVYQGDTFSIGGYRLYTNETPRGDLVLLRNDMVAAWLKIEDVAYKNAGSLILFLKRSGFSVGMLSGDRRPRCERLAKEVNIDTVYAEQTPQEKLEVIKTLQAQSHLAYVGDGVNDAPSLEAASVGIALGSGTDSAINAAQVVLLHGKLELVEEAYKLSRATVVTIKQNLFWAFFYNAAALPLAASGFFSPLAAALIMTLSDVFVIGNSLRLRFRKL